MLHWVSKNYVRRLLVDEQTGTATAETTSLLGKVQRHTFPISSIVRPELSNCFLNRFRSLFRHFRQDLAPEAGVFTSFTANGRAFFVHEELVTDKSPLLRKALGK